MKSLKFDVAITMNNWGDSAKSPTGYVDYFRAGAIEDDPNLSFFDEFDDPEFNGTLNTKNWGLNNSSEQVNGEIFQESGALVFTQENRGWQSVALKENFRFLDNNSMYIETSLKMEKGTVDDFLILSIDIDDMRIECNLHGMSGGWFIGCLRLNGPEIFNQEVEMNQEHLLRVEVDPQKTDLMFFVDGIFIDAYQAGRDSNDSTISMLLQSLLSQTNFQQLSPLRGYVNTVRIGTLETRKEDSP